MPTTTDRAGNRARSLVIVGGSLAGLRAAEAARAHGWGGTITMIGAESHLPYDRPPLSKKVLDGGAAGPAPVPFRSEEELADLGVRVVLGTPATALDAGRREVVAGGRRFPYHAAVIATGASAVRPPLPGMDLAGVHTLRTHDDASAVRAALERRARVVVVGAGFIGSEVASAARRRGLPVTIVEQLAAPLVRSLGELPGRICADLHREAGVDLRLSTAVAEVRGVGGQVTGVRLHDGEVLAADLVVVGAGARPATGWLAGSGIDLHPRDGGIVCSATLAASVPGVWAAGDVAHAPNRLLDDDVMRPEHWTNAAEQGALAARNAVGAGEGAELATVPYFWSDWHGHRLQFVGTPAADEVVPFGPEGPGAIVLYRRGSRLMGAFTVDRKADVMKFRRLISEPDGWAVAVEMATARARRPLGARSAS